MARTPIQQTTSSRSARRVGESFGLMVLDGDKNGVTVVPKSQRVPNFAHAPVMKAGFPAADQLVPLGMQRALTRSGMATPRNTGFTLIELLVVVAIVATLASIAIPQYAAFKKKGADAAMESALNSARNAMEAYYEANHYQYTGVTVAGLEGLGYRGSEHLELEVVSAGVSEYVVRACMPGGSVPSFVFDSDAGIIQGDSNSCS